MSGFEIFILVLFIVFMLWFFVKPKVLLEIQKKIYKLIGIEINYTDKAILVIRVIIILVIILAVFGLIQ